MACLSETLCILRDDTKYLLLGDNANKKLVLPNLGIGQIGEGEV
jgi:hypothetical protein